MSEKKENNLESIINENSYFYDQNGYIVLKSAIPNDLIDSYEKKWLEHHSKDGKITNLDGWQKSSSYLKNQQILDILSLRRIAPEVMICDMDAHDVMNVLRSAGYLPAAETNNGI